MTDNEIIENWDDFSDAMRMLEIKENPTAKYWDIWNEIDDIFKVQILQQPDIDYEKYIKICDENKKHLLYSNNKKLMETDLDWDNLKYKFKSHSTLNPHFDFEPYWDRMCDENKRTIIYKEDFDFDKYWDDLSLTQSLAYLKTANQYIDEQKMDKIVDALADSLNYLVMIFDHVFDSLRSWTLGTTKTEINDFYISDCDINEQKLLTSVFSKLNDTIIDINNLDLMDNDHYKLYKYKDNVYMSSLPICIKDYYIVQREEKLKRILKIKDKV